MPRSAASQRRDVVALALAVDGQRKPAGAQQDQAGQHPGDATVAVLERMDLYEAVMQERCLHLWRHIGELMGRVQLEQPVHLARDLLGRAVDVHRSVISRRVVGQALPLAVQERHLDPPPERGDGVARRLVTGDRRM